MMYIVERWKVTIVLMLSLLLAGLACVGSSRAQIKKEDVDFEVLATVTMVKGDTLWELAQKYYDDAYRWNLIMDLNKIPDERRIPIGTVIYIPVEDAKKIVEKVEEKIVEKKAVVKEASADVKKLQEEIATLRKKLKECQAKNRRLTKVLKECQAKNKRLTQALKKNDAIEKQEAMIKAKDATIKDLKARVAELEEKAGHMANMYEKCRAEKAEKDELIEKLESRIRRQRSEIAELEEVRDKLSAKIKAAEKKEPRTVRKPPPKPVKKEADPKAGIAAITIALIGSILWIASK